MHHNVKQRIRSRVYHSIMMPSSVRITRTKWRGREKKEGKGSTIIIDWLAILRNGRKGIEYSSKKSRNSLRSLLPFITRYKSGNNNWIASIFHVFSSFVLLTRPGEFSLRPQSWNRSMSWKFYLFTNPMYMYNRYVRIKKIWRNMRISSFITFFENNPGGKKISIRINH